MEKVRLYSGLERIIAHSDEVEGILGDFSYDILLRARARLSRHTKSGAHRVTQTKGKVDHFVNLEGPAAMSLEVGHWVEGAFEGDEPKFVEGLWILRDSIVGVAQ